MTRLYECCFFSQRLQSLSINEASVVIVIFSVQRVELTPIRVLRKDELGCYYGCLQVTQDTDHPISSKVISQVDTVIKSWLSLCCEVRHEPNIMYASSKDDKQEGL